jgi:hydroxymethylbilane synthase
MLSDKLFAKAIRIGARNSPLSRKQVEEVSIALKTTYPAIHLQPIFVGTVGDRDQMTSLRTLDKTDFFTREIDQMLLKKECRIGIHSAKDLPDPLPVGVKLGALTCGVDPADVLVLREGEVLPLWEGTVATSSTRREEAVRQLFPNVRFVDIRGHIHARLAKLWKREVDGVVIAEAALIRLGLTHLNRIRLPGETAPLQGKLALVIREDDVEMQTLLNPKILYLGLDPNRYPYIGTLVHFPMIQTIPRPFEGEIKATFAQLSRYSHVILTSRRAAALYLDYALQSGADLKRPCYISVGKATTELLEEKHLHVAKTAIEQCAEGIVPILRMLPKESHLFLPRSSSARNVIPTFCAEQKIDLTTLDLYDTCPTDLPLPNLDNFDQIVFTSPSTVHAFYSRGLPLPPRHKWRAIGPITQQTLEESSLCYAHLRDSF